jgi:hypothetical protein
MKLTRPVASKVANPGGRLRRFAGRVADMRRHVGLGFHLPLSVGFRNDVRKAAQNMINASFESFLSTPFHKSPAYSAWASLLQGTARVKQADLIRRHIYEMAY